MSPVHSSHSDQRRLCGKCQVSTNYSNHFFLDHVWFRPCHLRYRSLLIRTRFSGHWLIDQYELWLMWTRFNGWFEPVFWNFLWNNYLHVEMYPEFIFYGFFLKKCHYIHLCYNLHHSRWLLIDSNQWTDFCRLRRCLNKSLWSVVCFILWIILKLFLLFLFHLAIDNILHCHWHGLNKPVVWSESAWSKLTDDPDPLNFIQIHHTLHICLICQAR